jgi:threonine/homoserine/homoserine lactone efflux protein
MPLDLPTVDTFAVTAAAIVVSPGPDTMLILRYALISGRAAGLAAVAGVQIGLFVHTTLAVAGLSALVASSPGLLRALAVSGAAYLAWLGLQGFRNRGVLGIADAGNLEPHRACRDAVFCNVLNPKVIVLFLALYPNFIVIGRSDVTAQVLMLSVVLILINVSWQVGLVGFANIARCRLVRSTVQRTLNRITGAILIGFAAAMLWEHLT